LWGITTARADGAGSAARTRPEPSRRPAASLRAATKLLPTNSVGTRQVINHSLLKKDFKAGQIPCGPRGLQGDSGETGPQGPQGIQGPRGPSSGFYGLSNVIVGEVPDTEGSIGHLSLPAGKFIAFAKAAFVNPGAVETLVECEIKAIGVPNSSYDRGNLRLTGSTGATYFDAGVLSLTATTYASTISGFDFRCKDNNGLVQIL
jgi:hypothetical protein